LDLIYVHNLTFFFNLILDKTHYTLLIVPCNRSGNVFSLNGGSGFFMHEPFTQLPTL